MLSLTHQIGKNPSLIKRSIEKPGRKQTGSNVEWFNTHVGKSSHICHILKTYAPVYSAIFSGNTVHRQTGPCTEMTSAWSYQQARPWRPSGPATWAAWVNTGAATDFLDERALQGNKKWQRAGYKTEYTTCHLFWMREVEKSISVFVYSHFEDH